MDERQTLRCLSRVGRLPLIGTAGKWMYLRTRALASPALGHPVFGEERLTCPVCGNTSVSYEYRHTEFRGIKVRVCAGCGHGYANLDFVIEKGGVWSTRRDRADYHLAKVVPRHILKEDGTLLEIGSCDFYFLSKLQSMYPRLGLYSYDRYAKVQAPADILLVGDLDQVPQVDYVYASHCLEHIYDLDSFFEELSRRMAPGAMLILEVPNNSMEKHADVKSGRHFTGYHFHFFTEASFKALMSRYGLEDLSVQRCGPSGWGMSEGVNLVGVFRHPAS